MIIDFIILTLAAMSVVLPLMKLCRGCGGGSTQGCSGDCLNCKGKNR